MKASYMLLILAVFITCQQPLLSQKERNNWYFGYKAGITFNTKDGKPVALHDGQLSTWEGVSTASDKDGNLLFYTDGVTVWNKNHQVMDYGTNLNGYYSSTQSAYIVPMPGHDSIYYLFTTEGGERNQHGLCYSIVDLTYNSGLGSVVEKNIHLHDKILEKIAVAKCPNNKDYWIVTFDHLQNKFFSYLLTDKGFADTVVSNGNTSQTPPDEGSGGYLRFSHDNKRLVSCQAFTSSMEMFDFDVCTGKLSNNMSLQSNEFNWAYGLEFSPDNTKLYASIFNDGRLYQFDVSKKTADEITRSAVLIEHKPNFYWYGALQMGPDNKIYVSTLDQHYIGVINNPNAPGTDCDYTNEGVYLGDVTSGIGLPVFINDSDPNACDSCKDYLINYPGFKNVKGISFAGSAHEDNDYLRLTSARINSAGSAWYNEKVPLNEGFTTSFRFRFNYASNNNCDDRSAPGADGIAFLIQNDAPMAIGSIGGGIGYDGIPGSVAVEFDTYCNDSTQIINLHDPNGNHIAVQCNGNLPNTSDHRSSASLGCAGNIFDIKSDGTVYNATISYNKKSLSVTLCDSLGTMSSSLVIPGFNLDKLISLDNGSAFVGFTSATGCAYQAHDILSWNLCTSSDIIQDTGDENHNNNPYFLPEMNILPNPAASDVRVNFSISKPEQVSIIIYDLLGRKTVAEFNNSFDAGSHSVDFNLDYFASGLYYVQMTAGADIITKKLVVSR